MIKKVLFLCTGNICRSPMAEYLLKAKLKEKGVYSVDVESAGFLFQNGRPAAEHAVSILRDKGVDLSPHRAKVVTKKAMESADLVYGMEKRHLTLAMELAPREMKKMAMFSSLIQNMGDKDIPDPYGGPIEEYYTALATIGKGVESLASRIKEEEWGGVKPGKEEPEMNNADQKWTMLTIVGEDRPGIVARVTQALYEKQMNLGEASMLRLGGNFTIMLMVQGQAQAAEVKDIVCKATGDMGLRVHADQIEGKLHSHVEPNARISLFGADRAGIVAKATSALAMAGFNITLLETDVGGTAETPIYIMQMEGVASAGAEKLKDALADLAQEGVEINVEPIDTLIG